MLTETTTLCLNCGNPIPSNHNKFCDKKCGSIYRNRKAWEQTKQIPVSERRRSFYMTPAQSARPDDANLRRVAFMDALDELDDRDVIEEILNMIDALAAVLVQKGVKEYAAKNQATEFIAACVWQKVNVPRSRARSDIEWFPF